jgi:hypothetical protein
MKKLSFEKFTSNKIESSKIVGGEVKETKTTYDRSSGGTGIDKVYEYDDGKVCTDFMTDDFVHCT